MAIKSSWQSKPWLYGQISLIKKAFLFVRKSQKFIPLGSALTTKLGLLGTFDTGFLNSYFFLVIISDDPKWEISIYN